MLRQAGHFGILYINGVFAVLAYAPVMAVIARFLNGQVIELLARGVVEVPISPQALFVAREVTVISLGYLLLRERLAPDSHFVDISLHAAAHGEIAVAAELRQEFRLRTRRHLDVVHIKL